MYNGLNIHFEHRISHGLEFTTAYSPGPICWTIRAAIPTASATKPRSQPSKEWASGLTDQRNNLTIAFVWQLPKLSGGNAAARAVLNGWGFNSIFQYICGSPLWINQSADGENNGNLTSAPTSSLVSLTLAQQNDRRVVQYRRLHHRPLATTAARRAIRLSGSP